VQSGHRSPDDRYAIVNDSLSPRSLGDSIGTFLRREDADQFIDLVKLADTQLATHLRVV
jgi:hypothetical protein